MRTPSPRPLCIALAFALVGLAACGGSSSPSSTSSSSKSTTTTSGASTADDALAEAGSIQLADVGAGWTEYRKADGFKEITKGGCNLKFGSPLTASDQVYVGPMLRDATEQAFIYTNVVVFATESQAKAYTAMRNTQEFKDCKEAEDDVAQKKRDPKAFVRLDTRPGPALKDGLESFYEEEAGLTDADGNDVVNASYARYTVRKGRVVYTVSLDTALSADAAQRTAIGTSVTTAINAGLAAVTARLDALSA